MRRSKIEKICIFSFIGIVVASLVAVPLTSYVSYINYVNQISENKTSTPKTPKPVLQSIEAKLVDGKEYYANNLAKVYNSDIEVIAHYLAGEEESQKIIESDKFSVSTPIDFALKGGDITVSYAGKSTTIAVTLIPVKVQSITISKQPYQVVYQQGTTFNGDGMEVTAVYNDGSTKLLNQEDYSYEEKNLTLQDTIVKVTYFDNDDEKSTNVKITVVEKLNNGNVKNIELASKAYAFVGQNLNQTDVKVLGNYESGNKVLLNENQYRIISKDQVVQLGKAYQVTIEYSETIKLTSPVIVRQHLEGEDGDIVGGRKNTEKEYIFENGVFHETDTDVSFVGSFALAVSNNQESSLTYSIDSLTDITSNITMRCGNSYLVWENNQYYMKPLQINTILDLTVNGEMVDIDNDVILKGCGPIDASKGYAPLYGVYYEFTFEDVKLAVGSNEIKLSFKNSTEGAKTCWNESPSTMNIDYINIDSHGVEIPDNPSIKKIEFGKDPKLEFGTQVSKLNLSIIAVLANNLKILLDKSLYDIKIEGLEDGEDYISIGNYKLIVTLKNNPSLKLEKEFIVEPLRLEAENAELFGERVKIDSANEYIIKDGEYISGDMISTAYGMDYGTTHGGASLTFKFNAIEGNYSLNAKLDNAYYFEDGIDPAGNFYSKELSLKEVIKVKVNNEYITMNDVVLPAINGASSNNHIWMYFYEVILANISLVNGENTIVIEGNTESSLRNKWNEIPVPRFDWIELK